MIRESMGHHLGGEAASLAAHGWNCCLHLGMPKTATTCLQLHVFARHSQIAYLGKFPQHESHFPARPVQALNAKVVAGASGSVRRCRAMMAELITPELAAGRKPLWSKEGLTAGGPEKKKNQARLFRELLGDCQVVVFVRQPIKFIESMYFQNLKGFQKPTRTPPDWAHHFGKLPSYFTIDQWLEVMWSLPQKGAIGHLRCAETAEIYAEVFGRQRVRVFVFEQLVEDPRKTVAGLCRFMGVDPQEGADLFLGKRANDRWTVRQIERLKRIASSRLKSAAFRRGSRKTRQRMLGLDRPRCEEAAPKARAEIPALWQERIIEYSRHDHRRLAEEWGLPLERYGYPL